jgi:predicted AAA+ superfamily ATPase
LQGLYDTLHTPLESGVFMILKRKVYNELLEWKNKYNGTRAVLVNGARRVGKSFICEKNKKNEYKSMLSINFTYLPTVVREAFENDKTDLELFFFFFVIHYNVKLYPRESLILFDEVQAFPIARQMIKQLVADGRYDYIETGSLISIKENVDDILIPSEEKEIEMHPLDFEEFLWAMGNDTIIDFLRESFIKLRPLGQAVHRTAMNYFRQYMLVGGMPQSVLAYIKDKNFNLSDEEKRDILRTYRNDIAKYARGYKGKVTAIFYSLPGQLTKKEKKYKLSSVIVNARLRDYENAFMWLSDGMITNPCFNATDPNVGLALSFDHSTHKLYMSDTGLLVTHTFRNKPFRQNEFYRAVLFDKLSINEGMITENIVAQMLRFNNHQLFFYSRQDSKNRKNTMEIDFLIDVENKICPVEVKSSAYKAHSSLDKFKTKFKRSIGNSYVLYPKDIMIKDEVIHLPLYMAMFL